MLLDRFPEEKHSQIADYRFYRSPTACMPRADGLFFAFRDGPSSGDRLKKAVFIGLDGVIKDDVGAPPIDKGRWWQRRLIVFYATVALLDGARVHHS